VSHDAQPMARTRRLRQHANPLSECYAAPRAERVTIPAHLGPQALVDVELGCADAQFSFALARAHPQRFVLGLEIRDSVVARVQERAHGLAMPNLRIAYCNLAVDLDRVLPTRSVDRFHLLFPDPWFKPRHRKRRVLDPDLLAVIRDRLRDGGELHFASDVFELAMAAMADVDGESFEGFENLAGAWHFTRDNPYGVTSRREDQTLRHGGRVWRLRWRAR
jgi:tRNA (guanine-N7-)-methyltransferase